MLAHKTGIPANSEPEVPHFYLWLNGEARQGMSAPLEITSPFDGMLVGTASIAGRRQIREAILSSKVAYQSLKKMTRYQRSKLLNRTVELLHDSRNELVDAMILEGG
ncbi:MAG: aldehyde dehydrogenase family protein, partial [Mariprofundaceae bacterium]